MILHGQAQGKIAIIGWHEGLAGQLHALLAAEGVQIDCFVSESGMPPDIRPVQRKTKFFSTPGQGTFKDLPFLCTRNWPDTLRQRGVTAVFIAVPDPVWRKESFLTVNGHFDILSYVHSSAVMLPESCTGQGCILLPGAILGYRAELENCVVLNTGAQVDHHCLVSNFATLQPSATLCGNVFIGEGATVGAGATIVQRVCVGEFTLVGAGSLVLHDVEARIQVVGSPARFHKQNEMASE